MKPSHFSLYGLLFLFLIVGFFLTGCVSDEKMKRIDSRLAALERHDLTAEEDRERMRDKLGAVTDGLSASGENDKDLRINYADLSTRIEATKESILRLNGKIEETAHYNGKEYKELINRIESLKAELARLENRMKTLEEYVGFENSLTPPGVVPAGGGDVLKSSAGDSVREPTTPSNVPSDNNGGNDEGTGEKIDQPVIKDDEGLYLAAKNAFDKGDYGKSLELFGEILNTYEKSSHADNSQFWIGEIYYRQKWYEKAILEYQKVLEHYPDGNKAPAAMLKQGFAFDLIGDRNNARLILNELIKKYPKTPEKNIAEKKLKDLK